MEIDRDVRNFTNLHGDLIATTALTGTGAASATVIPATSASTPATIVEETEFGIPRGGMTMSARYGWLGGKRRQTDTATGITLMGQRLYEPTLGRFLQTDPVPGGSANAYDYAGQDPINTYDLDGRCVPGFCWAVIAAKATARVAVRAARTGARLAVDTAAVVPYGAYYAAYRLRRALAPHWSPRTRFISFLVDGALRAIERKGLAGDVWLDRFKRRHHLADESDNDEGRTGYINPFHSILPAALKGPRIYLPGRHQDGTTEW